MKTFLASGLYAAAVSGILTISVQAQTQLTGNASAPAEPLCLWYRQPATHWTQALPIGNGRIGAMIFGGINRETIQLNEDTLWAGGPYDPVNPEARAALPEVRQLIFAGQYKKAASLISARVMSKPLRQMPYETAGDLILTFPDSGTVENYRRQLDLDTAAAGVEYTAGGIRFTRQMFASPVDQVIVVRLTADKKGAISFVAGLDTPQQATVKTEDGNTIVMSGMNGSYEGIPGALRFQARVRVLADGGTIRAITNSVRVSNADSATILIALATSYRNYDDVGGDPEAIVKSQIDAAEAKSFNTLLMGHVRDYQRLFRRVAIDLGRSSSMELPTDERIGDFHNGQDPQLAAIYFQFARYLLISCSRPGGQPATLQGLWNESMNPPWGSKYTININTEMNYWPAEPGNLAECVEPLIAMVKDLSVTGARTAREMYGAQGWVVHHNTDLWRASGPIDGPGSGMWPTGGAWLCDQLWDHYEFDPDKTYLKEIYPIMRGAAQFFLETLVEDPTNHWLVTNPSLSPEHKHPFGAAVCAGPAMDEEILRDLFGNTMKAAEILGTDRGFRLKLAAAQARLAPPQIGSAGQLQEWLEDWDMQAPDIHHRHVSHLYALYPSWQINVFDTPELVAAAKRSLEIRGDESTGWATAWRINLWDRLHDGDHAFRIFEFLLGPQRTYPDMFDAHPPFQIDGNFGGAAGIMGMLLQSRALETKGAGQNFEIELLPALPSAWPDGSVQGLCARGGFVVGETWKQGKLIEATIHSRDGSHLRLRYHDGVQDVHLKAGQTLHWQGTKA